MNYQYSEKYIERRLRIQVEALGGFCLKWVSPGYNGVPDRIVLLPGNKIFFVELKSRGQEPSTVQKFVHQQFERIGIHVWVIDSIELLDEFIAFIA